MVVEFEARELIDELETMSADDVDELEFGVIGFDEDERVTVYSAFEAAISGLDPGRVIGRDLFTEVAPCTNNFLVAERFRAEPVLDEQLDYVFTLRMKPTPVRLRLLARPGSALRYMLVERRP